MTHGHQSPLRQRFLSLFYHTQPEQGSAGNEQSKREFFIEKRESWELDGFQARNTKAMSRVSFAFYKIYGRNLMDTGVSFTMTGN